MAVGCSQTNMVRTELTRCGLTLLCGYESVRPRVYAGPVRQDFELGQCHCWNNVAWEFDTFQTTRSSITICHTTYLSIFLTPTKEHVPRHWYHPQPGMPNSAFRAQPPNGEKIAQIRPIQLNFGSC